MTFTRSKRNKGRGGSEKYTKTVTSPSNRHHSACESTPPRYDGPSRQGDAGTQYGNIGGSFRHHKASSRAFSFSASTNYQMPVVSYSVFNGEILGEIAQITIQHDDQHLDTFIVRVVEQGIVWGECVGWGTKKGYLLPRILTHRNRGEPVRGSLPLSASQTLPQKRITIRAGLQGILYAPFSIREDGFEGFSTKLSAHYHATRVQEEPKNCLKVGAVSSSGHQVRRTIPWPR